MLNWIAGNSRTGKRRILCLGAHCDDIEIGCGGTLVQLTQQAPDTEVHCVVFSSTPEREQESRKALGQLLVAAEDITIDVLEFRNSFFPYVGAAIKERFEVIRDAGDPDLIFTHCRDDRHQDHRLISDLTWNTYRDHAILEYEIPKYDGDLTQVNTYVPLKSDSVAQKIRSLLECFPSQQSRQWFTDDTFRAIMRLRGIECNSPSGYAEGFVSRKAVISI